METIVWKEEFNIGIQEIDLQHKHLVNLINAMNLLAINKSDYIEVEFVFNQLVEYTQYHFKAEEKHFSVLSETDKKLHSIQHKYFIEALEDLRQTTLENTSLEDIILFLQDWLLNHILGEDKKLN